MREEIKTVTLKCDICGKSITTDILRGKPVGIFDHRKTVLPVDRDVFNTVYTKLCIDYGPRDADLCRECFVKILKEVISGIETEIRIYSQRSAS